MRFNFETRLFDGLGGVAENCFIEFGRPIHELNCDQY